MYLTPAMRKFTISLIIITLHHIGFAQSSPDSSKPTSLLFNGAEYVKQFNPSKGDPFFPISNHNGSVKYHQNWYNNIEVHYDCEDDYVVVRDMRGLLKLRLINEMLEEFVVDGHRFVKKPLVSPYGELYELIFEGKKTLLVKWVKRLNSDVKTTDTYVLRKHLLLLANGKVYPIENISDLLSFSDTHSKELRKVLKEKKLTFKKDPINASRTLLKEMEEKGW
ncbi:MAG: hypothetical protein RLY11_1559 [Bacteroidota bacterium]|jgi:hypothetical protein|nr:hypothetical protein [Chitinophagia bacterium]